MQQSPIKYHSILAKYFSSQQLFFDGDLQKKPHIRKCAEQPFQQTKAQLWDEVTDTLCNLDFIQAKSVAKMTYDLVKDFNYVMEVIPENIENNRRDKINQTRTEKYIRDLIAYSKGDSKRLEIPVTLPLRSKNNINTEIKRFKTKPTRLDLLRDFINFLGKEARNLQDYSSEIPHFSKQQAWNYAYSGPVGKIAEKGTPKIYNNLLLQSWRSRPFFDPIPQVSKILNWHTQVVEAISITPNGKWAVSGSFYGECILWDLNTGEAVKTFKGHTSIVNAVSITPDGRLMFSGSSDKTCILWDINTSEALKTFKDHLTSVFSTFITPDGTRAVSASRDNTFIVWDLIAGKALKKFKTDINLIEAFSITANGRSAISGSKDGTCILWDLDSGKAIKILKGHKDMVTSVSITPEGRRAISGSKDGTCILWDLDTGVVLKTLIGQNDCIFSVSLTPDGERAISCSAFKLILWDLNTGEPIKSFRWPIGGQLRCVSITIDGQKAVSGSFNGTCILWDLNATEILTRLKIHANTILAVSTTPNGRRALACSQDEICTLWNLRKAKIIKIFKSDWPISSICIVPNGRWAVSGSWDRKCLLWDLRKCKIIKIFKGHSASVNSVSIAPDGRRMFSGSSDKTCILWDINTGEALKTFKGHQDKVTSVSITPDGRTAISGSEDNTCILWDLNTGESLKIFKGHTSAVNSISISPDGRNMVSGSSDKTCILWDINTGEALKVFLGHRMEVKTLSISPDGRNMVSGSSDKTCILWDLINGENVARFISNSDIRAVSCFFSGVFGGDSSGNTFTLSINKLLSHSHKTILTIRQIWDFKLKKYQPISADCPCCGHRFVPTTLVFTTIENIIKKAGLNKQQSSSLELPNEVWEDLGLLSSCPKCRGELKFNPFIVRGDNTSNDNIEIKKLGAKYKLLLINSINLKFMRNIFKLFLLFF
jgi:WD40 repeat protein